MPAKARWLTQIPQMIVKLSALDVPVLDRAICERVFEVGRRQAIYLLKSFGGYECGNAFLIDRLNLIGQLKCMAEGEEIIKSGGGNGNSLMSYKNWNDIEPRQQSRFR